jgi:hypothetical protein
MTLLQSSGSRRSTLNPPTGIAFSNVDSGRGNDFGVLKKVIVRGIEGGTMNAPEPLEQK